MGVALTRCYFCGKDDKIVMNTLLTPSMAAKVESMHRMVIDMDPCQECKEHMKKGVMLIPIDNSKSEKGWETPDPDANWMPNPYRTGGFAVVREGVVDRLLDPKMAAWAKKQRFMFIEHGLAEKMGLFETTPTNPEDQKPKGNE